MKLSLVFFGLLQLLLFVSPANAQQNPQTVPPPPAGTPYMVPAVMPMGMPMAPGMVMMPVPPAGQAPPQGYTPDPNAGYPPQGQYWGPPQGAPMNAPPMGATQGQITQIYGGPDQDPQTPKQMTRYEQQEAALRESQMVEQLEDIKQQKEMQESFRNGILNDIDQDHTYSNGSGGFNGDKVKVAKTAAQKTGQALKTGARWMAPTASWLGTMFVIRSMGGF